MNFNIIGYIVFFVIMLYVIVIVGWKLYVLGRPFLVINMKNELHLVDPVNKMLLILYYLFNLGYSALSIQYWETINTINEMIGVIAVKSGTIIIILGVVHYVNLFWLTYLHLIIEKLNQINSYK